MLCGAGGLLLLAALCRRRVRQAAARERVHLTRRIAERERVARERHDVLLQSVTGLALQLHAAVKQMPPDSPQRGSLEHVLSRTNATLAEGRQQALELRCGELVGRTLIDALSEVRHELSQELPYVPIRVSVDGGPRRLTEPVHEQAYWISREVITHSARQPSSQSVEVEVHFRPHEFRVMVRNEGGAIAPDNLHSGNESRRSDLTGLAERARRIGGVLHVRDRPGGGTDVVLEVPAAAAYLQPERRWWSFT